LIDALDHSWQSSNLKSTINPAFFNPEICNARI